MGVAAAGGAGASAAACGVLHTFSSGILTPSPLAPAVHNRHAPRDLPPLAGGGKTSFLNAVAGRLPLTAGSLTWNGAPPGAKAAGAQGTGHVKRVVAVAPQRDAHEPLLTVRETLQFAADSCLATAALPPGVPTSRLVELTMECVGRRVGCGVGAHGLILLPRGLHASHARSIVSSPVSARPPPSHLRRRVLGLTECQHVRVGDELTRGV